MLAKNNREAKAADPQPPTTLVVLAPTCRIAPNPFEGLRYRFAELSATAPASRFKDSDLMQQLVPGRIVQPQRLHGAISFASASTSSTLCKTVSPRS